jgi:S-adenosylmethionine:tRNA ribosyltransferase-isomerase
MKTSDFDYPLPPEAIAQTPVEPRDSSRLLVLKRASGQVEHKTFHQIGEYLLPGDLLVVNLTRVIPARLLARKPSGGKVEVLLLRREDERTWECLVGGKGLRVGKRVSLLDGLGAEVVDELEGSRRRVRFDEPLTPTHLEADGQMPLPPYIHTKLSDPERSQTVYARTPGSAAAPTAGLHFTPRLLDEIRAQGVNIAAVTLHVGLDTFAPVNEDDPREHKIHAEWCELTPQVVEQIKATRKCGGRVIAVGSTSTRTLESAMRGREEIAAFAGPTSIYILPGYQYKVVDALITNFHLPKSTLIMLVSAFAGRETILQAYQTAVRCGYRFISFGDAMFII